MLFSWWYHALNKVYFPKFPFPFLQTCYIILFGKPLYQTFTKETTDQL